MSTDQLNRTRPPEPPQPEKAKLDLSFAKIMGGALAAMTAAALGSRLSVAGTLVGAALASIIAAVAGAIYTASLQHTKDKVRTVFTGRVAGSDTPARIDLVPESTTATQVVGSVDPVTQVPVWDLPVQPDVSPRPQRRALPWKSILIGAAAAFALAFAAVTGIELVTGQALSGGDGTTITQVTEPRSGTTESRSASPSPEPSGTDEPSATASGSVEPSASAPADPEPEPSAPASASTRPSQTPSPAPSASASASAPIPSSSAR